MGAGNEFAFAIGDILDKLERAAREVGKSLDHQNRLDVSRLSRVKDRLALVLEEIEALVKSGSQEK